MLYDATEHSLEASDGWTLGLLEWVPRAEEKGTILLGHAMMADRRSLIREDRPCIATTFVNRGFRVIAADARGHGQSGPKAQEGGEWTYHDLINDTGPLLAFARSRSQGHPVYTFGHSLFGHTSLAWVGRNAAHSPDAMIAVGVNIWCKQWEPSSIRWLKKRWTHLLMKSITGVVGRFPARALKVGSMDESRAYLQHFYDSVEKNVWADEDGHSYHPTLKNIPCPVLHVLSPGDAVIGDPESSGNYLRILGAQRIPMILGAGNTWSLPEDLNPDHMELLTSPESEPMWDRIASWLEGLP